ncbi:MAG: acetyl-CoA carboxylase biotin carboxyl carrier protein [Acidobacteriota bacterium]|nr:acetyl-CoA carboxylase biotin carboxyl carrier protein [Acidobacteriota bacterium]
MNFKEILELIDKVADRGIAGIEIEQAGTKLRIDGKSAGPQVFHSYVAGDMGGGQQQSLPAIPVNALPPASTPAQIEAAAKKAEEDSEAGLHIITSPIVGTFYRQANPESDAFVNVGDHITRSKVLCIIEAMKLMNEIESDVEGTLVKIYPQNGQPIEYGEKLFAVKV